MGQTTDPQWAPPPQQPAGWGTTDVAPPARPGMVTYAGIFLIVMGVIALLVALLAFAGGALFAGAFQGADGGLFAGIFGFLGVIILVWAIVHLLAGYGSLTGKNWGRITGIVISVIAVVIGVLGLIGVLTAGAGVDATSLIFQIVFIALYALAAWGLIQAGAFFAYRR